MARASFGSSSRCPHSLQNLLLEGFSFPQFGRASCNWFPQSLQNSAPSGFSYWHLGHFMVRSSRLRFPFSYGSNWLQAGRTNIKALWAQTIPKGFRSPEKSFHRTFPAPISHFDTPSFCPGFNAERDLTPFYVPFENRLRGGNGVFIQCPQTQRGTLKLETFWMPSFLHLPPKTALHSTRNWSSEE